mmetsp:Transcript_11387/g.14998  ORF Transcript_11387/g.14998 Transcript_11387/m.14998 type:complete len:88 (+) Transcript_11387:112-375(+)
MVQVLHEKSFNLARRWSVQNEPDMMMEDLYDAEHIMSNNYTQVQCASLAKHLEHLKQLPTQCTQYKEITSDLKRRDSDTTHGSEFLS